MARKVEVEITGDSSQLKREFQEVGNSARKLSSDVKAGAKSAKSDLDGMSDSFGRLRAEGRGALTGRGFRQAASGALRVAGGAFALTTALEGASVASAQLTGENTQLTHGLTDASSAIGSLLTLDVGGFFNATQAGAKRSEAAFAEFDKSIDDVNDSTNALKVATAAEAAGFDEAADAIRRHVALLKAAKAGEDALVFSQRTFNQTIIDGTTYLVRYKGAHDAALAGTAPTKIPIYGGVHRRTINPFGPADKRAIALAGAEGVSRIPILQADIAASRSALAHAKELKLSYTERLDLAKRIRAEEKEIAGIQKSEADRIKREGEQRERDRKERAKAAAELRNAARDRATALRTAKQYRALGLGPTGGALTPTVANLKRQFAQLKSAGEPIAKEFARRFPSISKMLAGDMGHLAPEVRSAIRDFFNDVRSEWKKGTESVVAVQGVDTASVMKGLGLSPSQIRALRNRLAAVNIKGQKLAPAAGTYGAYGMRVEGTGGDVYLDGDKVGKVQTRYSQRRYTNSPTQKRGPNARPHGI